MEIGEGAGVWWGKEHGKLGRGQVCCGGGGTP